MEETTISTLLNMGLAMAKSSFNDALSIPSLSYPNFKKCYGLEFDEPQVVIEEGYFMISTDLKVKPATLSTCEDNDQIYEPSTERQGLYTETIDPDEIPNIISANGRQAIAEPSKEQIAATLKAYHENEEKLKQKELAAKAAAEDVKIDL